MQITSRIYHIEGRRWKDVTAHILNASLAHGVAVGIMNVEIRLLSKRVWFTVQGDVKKINKFRKHLDNSGYKVRGDK